MTAGKSMRPKSEGRNPILEQVLSDNSSVVLDVAKRRMRTPDIKPLFACRSLNDTIIIKMPNFEEREARGASGRSWLFFGERNFRSDFLYQTEWQAWLADGLLSRIDVAFSRDRGEKVYVQHKLRERGAELFAWLEEGAHLYVCGDAANMAPDVNAALLDVLQQHGRMGPDAAEAYLRTLQRDHRYQRDVY